MIQPAPRQALVGTAGNVKLALQGAFDGPIDDSALDHALSDEDDSLSLNLEDDFMGRDSSQPNAVAPERLYSTPLSWEPPQAGLPMENYFNVNQPLNDLERQRLLAIAMGTGLVPGMGTRPQPGVSMDYDFDIHQSPTTFSDGKSNDSELGRKNSHSKASRSGHSTPTESADKAREKSKTSERAAHNDIERKYRTNLKDRIADLREAVPSLRSIPEDGEDEGDSSNVASRAPKVSKVSLPLSSCQWTSSFSENDEANKIQGTVLTKATEYIHQLERRNRSMAHKNEELTRRLQAFEQLLGAGAGPNPANWQPQGYGAALFNPNQRAFPS